MVKDSIEREYEQAIARACRRDDNESAAELAVGLKQYRQHYKVEDGDGSLLDMPAGTDRRRATDRR